MLNLDDIEHGVRVGNFSVDIAKILNFSDDDICSLYISSIFHDIGKAFLNQNILNKLSKLNKYERKHIQKHCLYGYNEVLNMGFSNIVANNILCHHENYDGSGYPESLYGNEIPIGARIIRIVDVFDALISDRPYREKFSYKDTISIMYKEKHFYDPVVFSAFISVLEFKYRNMLDNDVITPNAYS